MKRTGIIWTIVTVIALIPATLFATWVASNQRPDEHQGKFTGSALVGEGRPEERQESSTGSAQVAAGGSEEHQGKFTGSVLLEDRRFGVAAISTWDVLHHFDPFSMSEPGALFGTRSLGRHSTEFANNRWALVRIDLDTLTTETLYEEFTDKFIRNELRFSIREAFGNKVLLTWYGESESDFRMLDAKSGELEPLHVYEHLDRFGLSGPVNPKLVSPEGDLLVKSAEGNFLLRRASGDWLQLQYSHNFTTVYEGKLYFYTGKGHFAYDMELDQSTRVGGEQMKAVSAFRWRKSTGGLMTRGSSFTDESNKLEYYSKSPTGEVTSRDLPLRAADIR